MRRFERVKWRGDWRREDGKGVKFWGFVSRLNEFYWPGLVNCKDRGGVTLPFLGLLIS